MVGSTLYQYLVIICANICTVSYGTALGWTSAAILVLESDESPLDGGALTVSEIAWVGSLIAIGGIAGTIFTGWMTDKYGRKSSLLIAGFPMVVHWCLIIYAKNIWYLYIARFLSGFSGAANFVIIPLFVAEIADDSIRGTLGLFVTLSLNVGVLFGFVVGNYFSYESVPKVLLVIPVVFLITYSLFPESPTFLMKKNKVEKAESSLRFYRNIGSDCKDAKINENFQLEFNKLKNLHHRHSQQEGTASRITLRDFACKQVLLAFMTMLIHDCCGLFTLINYTAKIFAESGSNIPPNEAAIIVGITQLLGTYLSTLFIDRAGRKILFIISCVGTGLSHLVLATYIYLSTSVGMSLDGLNLIPVISFSSVVLIASFGAMPITYVIVGEIMPNKIRGMLMPMIEVVSWFCLFMMAKVFPPVSEIIGFHGCIFFFAGCCFFGALYIFLCLPETKGRSLEDIEESFKK